jgi:two-component system, sensor histidine kinase and response regulator
MLDAATILIVDDQPDNFDVIETLLFRENYQLHYASSGIKALERIDTIQPDVILLDVMMPDLDGVTVCRRIKEQAKWQHIPIIIVTALDSKEDLALCLKAGADDFISKPVNGLELRARVRSMLRIKKQYDALKESLKMRQSMSEMVVHDLRSPLTLIMGAASMLKKIDNQEKKKQKVEQILNGSKRLMSLIDSLLLMAKIEAGKMILHPENIDFTAVVNQAINDFQPIAEDEGIELLSKLVPAPHLLLLDATLCRRVLDNLISNAIKFAPENTQVIVELEYPENMKARVKVIDEGVGVNKNLQKTIFEKYEIGNLFPYVQQTGLGLAFCKMAVEAHEGRILIENNYPKGSIFVVELP